MSLEDLLLDVAGKLAFVENSLSQAEECCKRLQDNAQKIKDQIHEVVERQVVSLRGRERQLVRQVEVVTAHQACLLGTHQAGLVHSKGALTATRDLLQRCSPNDTSTLNKIKVDDVSSRSVCPVNFVSVQLDESAISGAVAEFGQVRLPDTITHHSSPVIPAKVEEYEDAQHDVLHKSVAGESSGPDSPLRVTVTFPRLTNQNWLAKDKKTTGLIQSSKAYIDNRMNTHGQSGDITSWLSSLQLAGAQEEDDQPSTPGSLDSYDIVGNRAHSVRTSECSSIEIVPSHYDSEKNDFSPPSSVCEIENLHHFVGEKSRWLCQDNSPSPKLTLENMKMKSICQANEACSTLSACLFQNSCGESALEKAQQSAAFKARMRRKRTISKTGGAEEVLAHMMDIKSSENSQWLLKQGGSPVFPRPVKRAMYELPSAMWLRQTPPVPNTRTPAVVLTTHSNIWLLSKLRSQKEKLKQEKDESEIEKDEDEKESRITTKDLANALEKVSMTSETPSYSVGRLSPVSDTQSWLFPKKFGHTIQAPDNKLVEMGYENKNRWLVYSSLKNSTLSTGSKLPSPLPEPILDVAQTGINNWLMKRL